MSGHRSTVPAPPLETVEEVDEELERLVREINRLRAYRNSLVPISRLPPELLSKIFLYGTLSQPRSLDFLIATSRVCSHWREVVLENPSLWSYGINFDAETPNRTMEALRRSNPVPLHVQATIGSLVSSGIISISQTTVHNVTLALRRPLRLRELDLQFSPRTEHGLSILHEIPNPAPSLESLSLSFQGFRIWHLPKTVLELKAPRLRRLSLRGFFLPDCSFPIFQHLTHLIITHSAAIITPDLLLNLLEASPVMQALILPSPLNSRDPRDDKTRLFRRRAVALPELRSLHLNARVLELHYLLQHLVIPCGILSKLECLADTTDIEHTNSDIWSTVSSKFSDMVGPNALQKVVMAQRISGMTLTARTGDDVVSLDVISELQIVLPGVESHSFLLQLCDILPFGQVRLLVADPCLFPDNKSTLWLPTLGNFDMVEDLVIGHFQYPHRPVEILQQLFTELASSGDQPAMPCLQNLVLEQFDLSRVVTYSSGDDSFSRVDFCRTLTKWLKRRILHGQCVKRVEFVRCRGVTEGVLAQLDGVVEKVANTLPWD